jgi:hypothetical protein
MAVSFKKSIEESIADELGIKRKDRQKIYEVPNMRRIVTFADTTMQNIQATYENSIKTTLLSAVSVAKQARIQGHALDEVFTNFEKEMFEKAAKEVDAREDTVVM